MTGNYENLLCPKIKIKQKWYRNGRLIGMIYNFLKIFGAYFLHEKETSYQKVAMKICLSMF